MRNGLFARFFGAILAAMLVASLIFTAIMMTSLQRTRQEAYETEVMLQAQEIADYMSHLNQLSSLRDNVTMKTIVRDKIGEIQRKYQADIWILSYQSKTLQVLDSSWNTSESPMSEAVLEQMNTIQEGKTIRVTGLFPELGDHIVTIGVPWFYGSGRVVGAVLLHISNDALQVSIREVLFSVLPAALLSVALGTLLSFFLARSQTKPVKEIDDAVHAFTEGDLTRRIELRCGGELEALGNSINRMAEELSQLEDSRRHFVAAVSHELRSPMTSMRGYIEAMLDGTIDREDQTKYLNIVLSETNRLTDLVRDLLDLSRFESGKFPLEIAPFDVNEMMRRVLISFEQRIDQKHIEVDVRFDDERCFAQGDMRRVNQVISNLVDNALKFTGEGDRLTLLTHRDGGNVLLSVANNGPAISEQDLPHIFDRFYTANRARTSGSGTGLGLSICALIVRQHGSELKVRSDVGETAFSFVLPAAEAPEKPTAPEIKE